MHHRKSQSRSIPIEKILFFVSIAFLVSCVIVAINRYSLSSEADAAARSATPVAATDRSNGADAPGGVADTDGDEEEEDGSSARAHWPPLDRVGRLRFGVVQDVADAFALGKYSGRVSLGTESEQLLFDSWCARAAAWSDEWNRDPVLYADGKSRDGAPVYRVELHGEELGRIHTKRYANGWNIVGVERKITEADIVAEQRILQEAAARAGVVRRGAGIRAAKSSATTKREREQRDQ